MEHWLKDEVDYFNTIKHNCKTIFDVGASYSPYVEFEQEVHYFDPQPSVIENLKTLDNINNKSFFNNFGLNDVEVTLPFYQYGDFVTETDIKLGDFPLRTGFNYMLENNLTYIDFLKIDVEGFELKVLKGFGDYLNNIKHIQFEYGTGLRDAGSNLLEVVTYLKQFGFDDFSIMNSGVIITDFNDNWNLCNITCINKKLI